MAALVTRAGPGDVPAIREIVDAAYSKYVDRIGKPPAPMVADYERLVDSGQVHVLRDDARGELGFGYGRVLLEFAERFGRNGGFVALTLFTNVKMHENFGLYAKMGYSEVGRRTESGYERVFFLKKL